MNSWTEAARILVSLIFLIYSSWHDIRKREVSNKVWLVFAPIGLCLSLLHISSSVDRSFPILMATSVTVTTGLSFLLFYLGLFGGADAKALICLSITIPVPPAFPRSYLNQILPIFPLSVLVNAVFVSSTLVFGILVYNVPQYLKAGGEFFDGLEDESSLRKLLLFLTGIKVNPDRIRDDHHFIPLETISEVNGRTVHHLSLLPQISDESLQDAGSLRGISGKVGDKVWVTPSIPFLVFVTVGFLVAMFLGDVPIWLLFRLLDVVS
jgi:preflagellin peptidase FlaK